MPFSSRRSRAPEKAECRDRRRSRPRAAIEAPTGAVLGSQGPEHAGGAVPHVSRVQLHALGAGTGEEAALGCADDGTAPRRPRSCAIVPPGTCTPTPRAPARCGQCCRNRRRTSGARIGRLFGARICAQVPHARGRIARHAVGLDKGHVRELFPARRAANARGARVRGGRAGGPAPGRGPRFNRNFRRRGPCRGCYTGSSGPP